MQPGVDYSIEKLSSAHQLSKFSIGPDPSLRALKTFLQHHALNYQTANVAVSYVAVQPPTTTASRPQVVGYVTLTCSEVDLKDTYLLDDCEHANRYSCMPALKIARLASHSQHAGKGIGIGIGIGKALMDLTVALAADHIGNSVGCRFLITDAKASAIRFYEVQGFTLLDTEENRNRTEPVMFLDLNKLHAK